MNTYKRYRFPPDIISYPVRLYHRFNLSYRDFEDLLAERGITVSYESIRLWCIKSGARYARRLKRRHRDYGDTMYISVHAAVYNLFNLGRHLVRAEDYRNLTISAFNDWGGAVA